MKDKIIRTGKEGDKMNEKREIGTRKNKKEENVWPGALTYITPVVLVVEPITSLVFTLDVLASLSSPSHCSAHCHTLSLTVTFFTFH